MFQRARSAPFHAVLLGVLLVVLVLGSASGASAGDPSASAGKEVSATPASLPEATVVRELTELRTEKSKTFELSDGQRELVCYGEAVHYEDASGVYQDIDDSIVTDARQIDGSTYAFRNGANAFTARFGASATDPRLVMIEYQGTSIAFGPAGARGAAAKKTTDVKSEALTDMTYGENLVGYPEVYPGVDLFYELKTYGVKEYLTLRRPNAKNEFTFNLVLKGLTPKEADGRITFVNGRGETLFWLAEPVAVDNAGVATKDVAYSISGKGSAYKLTVTVSPAYLADADRAYPVIVDPDFMITGIADTFDTYVSSRYPRSNYTYHAYLRTGRDDAYYTRRTYLRFDLTDALGIGADNVTAAYIRIEKYSGATPVITAYRNTGSWSSGTVTWNTMPAYTTSEHSTTAYNDSGSWWRMYNLTVVKKWLNGTYPQYGWVIRDATESGTSQWTTFYSCNSPSPHKPELHIQYDLTPQAIAFGYNVDAPGQDPNPDIHTWYAAQDAASCMTGAGYSGHAYKNYSAYTMYNSFGPDAIWYWAFHGGVGGGWLVAEKCVNDPPYLAEWKQYLEALPNHANTPGAGSNTNGAHFYLNNLNAATATRTLLAVFQGCYTGLTRAGHGSDPEYNLCGAAVLKGVDCAIGFQDEISAKTNDDNNPTRYWADCFFAVLCQSNCLGVWDSAEWASWAFLDHYGDFGGYDSYIVYGDYDLEIRPQRYGGG
jgi:hypothetical protein